MKEIVKYLYNEKPNIVQGGVLHDERGHGITPKKHLDKYINWVLNHLPDDKVYLIVQAAYSPGHAIYFTNKTGQIINGKNKLKEFLIQRNGVICHYMYFNTIEEAENCKSAMQRPLLRFSLYITQTDQHINPGKHYKYIPNINWKDDKVKTDEGILELCGCLKEKAKEYSEYCKNIINKINEK